MCRENLPSNVGHIEATKAGFETLKSRMIFAQILLIPKMGHEAEFDVATDSSKVGIVGMLLQQDTSRYLKPCAYWARQLKDIEIRNSAYDREALAIVEVVSRVWRVY